MKCFLVKILSGKLKSSFQNNSLIFKSFFQIGTQKAPNNKRCGEEIKRYQADISFSIKATKSQVQGKIDDILMESF